MVSDMVAQGTFTWHSHASKEKIGKIKQTTTTTDVSRIGVLKESIIDTMLQELS